MLDPVTLFLSTEDDIIHRPSFKFLYLSHPSSTFHHRIAVSMWLLEVEKAHGVRGEGAWPNVLALLEVDNQQVCGLKFTSFSSENFGWWSCEMSEEVQNSVFHRGTFKINAPNQWPTDIRLPTYIQVCILDGVDISILVVWGWEVVDIWGWDIVDIFIIVFCGW